MSEDGATAWNGAQGKSPRRQEIEAALGQDAGAYVVGRRDKGMSWAAIAREMTTDAGVPVGPQVLADWERRRRAESMVSGGGELDGEQITARQLAVPQERACPTCGGPVVTKSQREAEIADYAAWVDRGTPIAVPTTAAAPLAVQDIRRVWEQFLDRPFVAKCRNCGGGLDAHGPDLRCPPFATSRDLLQTGDGER